MYIDTILLFRRPSCHINFAFQRCPENAPSFRQAQCSTFDNRLYRGRIFDRWIPSEGGENEQCALHCRSQSHGFVVRLEPKVADGTECSLEDTGDTAVCVDGKCLVISTKIIIQLSPHYSSRLSVVMEWSDRVVDGTSAAFAAATASRAAGPSSCGRRRISSRPAIAPAAPIVCPLQYLLLPVQPPSI